MFIDDIKIIGPKRSGAIKNVKRKLATAFEIVDMRPISFYIDVKVEQNQKKRQ